MKIKAQQLQMIQNILRKHDVKRADLFGSFARGDAHAKSDFDILFEFKGRKSLIDQAALKRTLEESLNRRVDLITYGSIYPKLKPYILEHRIALV